MYSEKIRCINMFCETFLSKVHYTGHFFNEQYNFHEGSFKLLKENSFIIQKQPLEVFCKKGVLKNFAKFTG